MFIQHPLPTCSETCPPGASPQSDIGTGEPWTERRDGEREAWGPALDGALGGVSERRGFGLVVAEPGLVGLGLCETGEG